MLNWIAFAIILAACQSLGAIAVMAWALKKATDKEFMRKTVENSLELTSEIMDAEDEI